MNLAIRNEILASATEAMDSWRKRDLSGEDITDLLALAKENSDWAQISALALVIACIYEETKVHPKQVARSI